MRLCVCFTDFAYIFVRLLSTYTAYLLRKLCRFCIRIRIFVRVERLLILWKPLWSDLEGCLICLKSRWSDLEGSLICWNSVQTLVMIGPSGGSDLYGPSISFSARAVRYYWTVWMIRYLWLRWVLYPKIWLGFTVRLLPWSFLVYLDRAIYLSRWGNITLHYSALC